MVDEAQDFGALELKVLLSSVRSRTGVTIVGDVNQKIMPSVDFVGWDALAGELGLSGAEVARLSVAHRSSRPIMEVANTLTGDETTATRPGKRPRLRRFDQGEHLYRALVDELYTLTGEHEHGHVVLVTRHVDDAKKLANRLQHDMGPLAPSVRYAHNDSFKFEPGVTVTSMRQIKGLEFDAVVVLDPTEGSYPSKGEAGRRWLYTLLTRAKSDLLLMSTGEPSSLLATAIAEGLLQVQDDEEVPVFEADDEESPF